MLLHHNNSKGCWILYPRSDGSSVHPITTILKDVGGCYYTTTILKDVGSYIQGPMDRVSIIELQECWRMFSHHNNIKGCWILNPRSDGSSVHPTTTISKHVGSLIQRIVECPCKHTNLMTSPTNGGGIVFWSVFRVRFL